MSVGPIHFSFGFGITNLWRFVNKMYNVWWTSNDKIRSVIIVKVVYVSYPQSLFFSEFYSKMCKFTTEEYADIIFVYELCNKYERQSTHDT